MLNYSIVILLSTTVLVTHNIILLNEETLILICFIAFLWLSLKNLSTDVQENLQTKISTIETNLKGSLRSSLSNLQKLLNMQKKFWTLLKDFKKLGRHCSGFVNVITDLIITNSHQSAVELFPQKLQFTSRLESQTAKLLSKLIVLKLKKSIELKSFYFSTMSNPYFICSNKIVIRECIQKINSKG